MSKQLTKKALRNLIADVFNEQWQQDNNDLLREADVSNMERWSDTELTIYSNGERFIVKIIKPRF